MNKTDIRSLSYQTLEDLLTEDSFPRFRTGQVFSWLHQHKVESFDEMTNIPKDLLQWLTESYSLTPLRLDTTQVSKLDGTIKYLFGLADGHSIETVQMTYKHGSSLCVSTQVGCRMGCGFCASTLGGLVRNITTAEILGQVYAAEKISGQRISNIVLMGIGEPLDNFDAVTTFLSIIAHPKGHDSSLRNITLSTCGLVEEIRRLADINFPITLAVSLHAGTDQKRNAIMPINKKWNIASVLDACRYYFGKTGRRLTFEYGLISSINDSPQDAIQLASLLHGLNCHVNLIPINSVTGNSYQKSSRKSTEKFAEILTERGIPATIRRELGSDISAACGQLRHESLQ